MPAAPGNLLFLLQLAPTLFMTGLIWFVQVVHYPLFPLVGRASFPRYQQQHAHRTGWVVFPPMLLELLTALATLSPRLRPTELSRPTALASAALVLLIWLSTALLQIPLHSQLDRRTPDRRTPDPTTLSRLQRRLVQTNWLRTAAWTARSALLLTALLKTLNHS